jgi:lipid II:glycine glycyltransferase (peptidoglycan interpeptide bridge formation enzyme)
MRCRKSYIGSDQEKLLDINSDLPMELRLKIIGCRYQQETIAVLGWSNMGHMAIPIIGFTGDKALQFKASFLLWWQMIQDCQRAGFERCDLAAANPKRNPGGYFFKKGLAGKESQEFTYLGQFDAYASRTLYCIFDYIAALREITRKALIRAQARLRQ